MDQNTKTGDWIIYLISGLLVKYTYITNLFFKPLNTVTMLGFLKNFWRYGY